MTPIDYCSVFESTPTPCLLLDTRFVIVAASPAYLQATHRERADLVGKNMFVAFPGNPDDPAATGIVNLSSSLQNVLDTRAADTMAVQKYDIPCTREDGSSGFEERFWSPVNSPVINPAGELIYILHRVQDVTEFMVLQKRDAQLAQVTDQLRDRLKVSEMDVVMRASEVQKTNNELRAAYARLDRLDQLRTQFFANVSHELRTPISLILWPAAQLLTRSHDAQDRRDIEVIRTNAQHLLRQVNALLDSSKIEAGQMNVHYTSADAAQLLRAACTMFGPRAQQHRICIVQDIPEHLDADIDIEKFQGIVSNLLSNAFKYTPDDGLIRCSLLTEGDTLVLEVADSGPGIPQDQRAAIFERFHQVDGGANRRRGGTGLGLSIVRDFAALQGGSALADAAPEGGALFVIRLSRRAPPDVEVSETAIPAPAEWLDVEAAPTTEPRKALPPKLRGLPKILIVEDNPAVQWYLQESLSDRYDVACANNGRLGLQAIELFKPDTVICDVMMPEMTGPQMLVEVKRNPAMADIPILFLTAKSDDALRLSLLSEGAHDYLVKPFPIQELRARLQYAVSLFRVRQVMQKELESSVKDIELLAHELALQKRKAQALYNTAQEALTARSDFLTIAAHELRTPITALQLQLERLRRRAAAVHGEQLVAHCNRLTHQGKRLTLLINELLDASALEHGQVSLHLCEVDMCAVTIEVCQAAAAVAAGNAVPPIHLHTDSPVSGRWDRLRLEQIVTNLLSNAIKYGQGNPIDITVQMEGDVGVLRVQDQGIGIALQDQKRVFERFERAISLRNISGLGMGLYIVHETVLALQGSIEMVSELGAGSIFIVRLPTRGPTLAHSETLDASSVHTPM